MYLIVLHFLKDMSSYVKKVHFKLHESYANPLRGKRSLRRVTDQFLVVTVFWIPSSLNPIIITIFFFSSKDFIASFNIDRAFSTFKEAEGEVS